MRQRTEQLLWMTSALALLAVPRLYRAGMPAPLGAPPRAQPAITPLAADDDSLGVLALAVVRDDPFRFARSPSRIPYGAIDEADAGPGPTTPSILLSGIIGPPWRALLASSADGEAQLVRVGDTLRDVQVRSVRRHEVVLQQGDSIWTLTLERR